MTLEQQEGEKRAITASGPVDASRSYVRDTSRLFKPLNSIDIRITQQLFKVGKKQELNPTDEKLRGVLEAEGEWLLSVAEELDIDVNWDKINESMKRVSVTPIRS